MGKFLAHMRREVVWIHIPEKSTEPQLNSTLIYYAIRLFRFIKMAAKVYFIWFEAQVNLNNISTTTKNKYYGSLYIFNIQMMAKKVFSTRKISPRKSSGGYIFLTFSPV